MIAYLHEKLLTQALYLIKELVLAMIQGYEIPILELQNLVDSSIVVAE